MELAEPHPAPPRPAGLSGLGWTPYGFSGGLFTVLLGPSYPCNAEIRDESPGSRPSSSVSLCPTFTWQLEACICPPCSSTSTSCCFSGLQPAAGKLHAPIRPGAVRCHKTSEGISKCQFVSAVKVPLDFFFLKKNPKKLLGCYDVSRQWAWQLT